ncbi:conjugative transfer protein TraI [Legionella beliardensis]|uniref:Conjugative transfer protein TraI n=1 Tax=Legionella beliardensis TaxID=91822 RepID=A0A378JSC5_9GAMM|nr:hypothetical protein [Legionella beliardensis]STX55582.1 conjugative transfer protein TraI [Legionella beliardensis]
MTASTQLMHHEQRFHGKNEHSLQAVINKKIELESLKLSDCKRSERSHDSLLIKRGASEVNKDFIKELEL